jgi:signal transduction histidine kinase
MQIQVDPRHLKTVLSCLLRNAIEAAPADGWAGIRIQESGVRSQGSESRGQEAVLRHQEPTTNSPNHSPLTTHHSPSNHSPLAIIELIVEDNGPGVAPPQREHMFDPFYSGRQAGRGHGLGLPIAWRLARQIGGDVRFEDIPNGPTRFVLSLPKQTAEQVAPASIVIPHDTPAAA